MQKRGSCYLTKAVVFCFCPKLLLDTEGGHVSRTKIEGAVLISCALLLMRSSLIIECRTGGSPVRLTQLPFLANESILK